MLRKILNKAEELFTSTGITKSSPQFSDQKQPNCRSKHHEAQQAREIFRKCLAGIVLHILVVLAWL